MLLRAIAVMLSQWCYACFRYCRTILDWGYGNFLFFEELLARQSRFMAGDNCRTLMRENFFFLGL